jgi:osmotically-inducible protein OsmY
MTTGLPSERRQDAPVSRELTRFEEDCHIARAFRARAAVCAYSLVPVKVFHCGLSQEQTEEIKVTISDTQLRHDVEAELDWDTRLDSRQIAVAVNHGTVALSGQVPSYSARQAAEGAALSVAGVRAVANDIIVELPSESSRADAEIAEAAADALKANDQVPVGQVKIAVRGGWITLGGEVKLWHEKAAAENALIGLRGLKGISNDIAIRSNASVTDVETRIVDAFRRRAQLDARQIHIRAMNGTVTLEGHVRTYKERQEAEFATWQAPGVIAVVDELTVQP